MDEKQAAILGELMKNPKFAMLQGLCSELGQAQENALNNKHTALHMQMITFTQSALSNTTNANKTSGLGSSAPTGGAGLGSAPAANNGNTDPADSAAAGGEFNPANWDVAKNGVDYYAKTLFYLYDKLRTTESGNPNALIYFLEGLAKLSQYGGSSLLDKFSNGLCQQMGALNQMFCGFSTQSTNPQSFATLIAFALVTLAIYETSQNGGSKADAVQLIEGKYLGMLGGNNPFLNQIRSALSQMLSPQGLQLSVFQGQGDIHYTIDSICQFLFSHSGGQVQNGLSQISKILLQQILESLFGGTQGSNDPDAITDSQSAVRQAFSQGVLDELNQMEKNGATIAELIDFVMMQYNLASDDAGAYVGNINDLSGLQGDTSTLLSLFAPGKYQTFDPTDLQDFTSYFGAYYRLTQMWPYAPNVIGGGDGSLEDILTGQLMQNLNSLQLDQNVFNHLGGPAPVPIPNTKPPQVEWEGLRFSATASFGELMGQFKTLFLTNPQSKDAQNAALLLVRLIGCKNHESEPTSSGDFIFKRDAQLDSVVSSLQAIESQVSSANETAKAQYQQANQTSANLLSTGGDMMKDLMKMFSTSVQNEKAGV